jgi:hypothetical protein
VKRNVFVLLVLSLLFYSWNLSSQSLLKIGIRGAYTTSSIETNVAGIASRTINGHQAGVFFRLGRSWHVQPEFLFSSKGGKLEIDASTLDGEKLKVTQTIHLQTLEIPVLLGTHLLNFDSFNLRLQAGPSYNVILDKNVYISNAKQINISKEDLLKQIDNEYFNLKVGAGVDIAFVTLDVRYEFGIGNFYNHQQISDFDISTYNNNVFIVSLGIRLLSIL